MLRSSIIHLALLGLLVLPAGAAAEIRVVSSAGVVLGTPVHDNRTRLLGWTGDGDQLLVVRQGRAFRMAPAGGPALAVPALDGATQLGPGGRSAISMSYPARLTLRGADGHEVVRLAPADPRTEAISDEVAWTPDGRQAAIVVDQTLLVLDADTGATIAVVSIPGIDPRRGISAQAFSPDGSALVVRVDRDLVQLDVATKTETVVERLSEGEWEAPVWSTTGAIAMASYEQLKWIEPPRWSPDGNRLTYTQWLSSGPCSADAAVRARVPGAPAGTLFRVAGWIKGWAWSSDSQKIAVSYRLPVEHRGKRHPWPHGIPRSYEMVTRAGDRAVRSMLLRITTGLRRGAGREKTLERLRAGLEHVFQRHDEARDIAVQEAVALVINRWLHAAGFRRIAALDDLDC